MRLSSTPSSRAAAGILLSATILGHAEAAGAYIGPGAGIAFFSSFFIFLASFAVALLLVLLWPLHRVWRSWRAGRARRRLGDGKASTGVRRVVIIGLDGLDPGLAEDFMARGLLPNLRSLAGSGGYRRLRTAMPSLSPVVWSTFATGTGPARHAIFDFFTRDPRNYQPALTSVETIPGRGRFGRPRVRSLKKGRAFWEVLGEAEVPAAVLRVPITYPPVPFPGRLLSAMCVPDLLGTQGSFSFYTDREGGAGESTGGQRFRVTPESGRVRASLPGPAGTRLPFSVTLNGQGAILDAGGKKVPLGTGVFSPWVPLSFRVGKLRRAAGTCRFLLRSPRDPFELYVTPVNIDPERPAVPVSHPFVYAAYLSQVGETFATLGLAEDTWALNERVLDEEGFLAQAALIHAERERMFLHELDKTRRGVVACVFDATDRIQHMFWRYTEADHPARAWSPGDFGGAIEKVYREADALVGRALSNLGEKDLLLVLSDHGFASFRRCVDLNAWLRDQGYLVLRNGADTGGAWMEGVDWSRTRAYAVGLAGIYLNLAGRERDGIVAAGEEAALRAEVAGKLAGLRDGDRTAVLRVVEAASLDGPYGADGPDLLVGYAPGWRVSWEAAVGKTGRNVFEDNLKAWSGDHCCDPSAVPGVLFCNRPLADADPGMEDVAPTILAAFNLAPLPAMQGRPLSVHWPSAP